MTPLGISLVCVFVQVALTFGAILRMGAARIGSVKAKEVTIAQIAVDTSAYSLRIQQLQNNVRNQFETPILFYALVAIGAAMTAINWGVALASVGYIATRVVHHVIHTGSNRVSQRFRVFTLGLGFLAIGWVALGVSLIGIV